MALPMSSGQIAETIRQETGWNINRDQVNYALLRSGIDPIGRAGRVRLFGPGAVAIIKAFLGHRRSLDKTA